MNTPEENAAPADEERLVLGVVRVAARKAGMTPYEWVLSVAVGGGAGRAPEKKRRGAEPMENTPTAADLQVSDEQVLEVLGLLYDEQGAVRAGAWAKGCDGIITKGGFYARLDRLVAEKKVLVEQTQAPGKFYGREMMMKVKLYHLPEKLREADPFTYGKLTGQPVVAGGVQ